MTTTAATKTHETVLDIPFSVATSSNSNTGALPKNNSELSLSISATQQSSASSHDPLLLETRRKSTQEILAIKGKKVQEFYRNQNALIESLLSPLEDQTDSEDAARSVLKVKIAVNGSIFLNIALLAIQLYAAIASGSLSLFATMADSFMDLLSNVILYFTSRASNKKDRINYPTGKRRMETVGIIVFSSLMSTVSIQLMIEATRSLIGHGANPDINVWVITFISIALGAKSLMFLYCRSLRQYPPAFVLMVDCRNDIFVNAFGLTTALLGDHIVWWFDPVGCLLVALIILASWVTTAYEQTKLIVGKSADTNFLQRVTYIAMTHHEKILAIDTARAYHSGTNLIVEVDIIMDKDTPLWETHDISERLQEKFETLPNVERAFVHVDYEGLHKPEHQKKDD